MSSLNRIVVIGRLCRDPEPRMSKTGVNVTRFTVAVDRTPRGGDNGRNDEPKADFFKVVCWRHTADFVGKYLLKGNLVAVEGEAHIETWTDRDNNQRTTVEIAADNVQSLQSRSRDSAGGGDGQPGQSSDGGRQRAAGRASDNPFEDEANGDEDPFGD